MKRHLNPTIHNEDNQRCWFDIHDFNLKRWFGYHLIIMSVLASFAIPLYASDSCDLDGEVTIAYKGIMCAYGPYSITLNGTVANGPGDLCVGISASTPKTFTKLKLDKTYQMTAGSAICITTINFEVPDGYTLFIDGQESNQIIKSDALGHVYSGDGTWNIVVRKKCNCGPTKIGEATSRRGSVLWDAGMGTLTDGRSAEGLSIHEKTLSASIYTPSALTYSPPGLSSGTVDVVTNGDGSLRQIKTPQGLADIVVINGSEYDVRYYRPADVGAKTNGIYALSGQPFVTWKIKNPDPTSFGKLLIQKIENGAVVDQSEYTWDAITDSWTLRTGWTSSSGTYARVDSSWVSHPKPNLRTVVNTIKDGNGQVASKTARTYQTFPWGEELVQEILDPEVSALTTTYDYYVDPADESTYGQLKSVVSPDGSWEKYEYNEQDWTVSTVLRPWKDLALKDATLQNTRATLYQYARHDGFQVYGYYKFLIGVQEQIEGQVVRNETFTRWSAVDGVPITVNGEPVVREEDRQYALNSLSQATTTTRYYMTATPFLANRISDIEYPDGRKDTFTYEKGNFVANIDPSLSQFSPDTNGLAERETVTHGTVSSPDGVGYKTTKETTIRDQFGNSVLQETYVYSGSGYERIAWTAPTYNTRSQLTQTVNHIGQISSTTWNGAYKISEIDQQGIETVYSYDPLGQINTSTKKGIAAGGGFAAQPDIITTFTYDAAGSRTAETISGGSLSLTKSTIYDRSGRVTRENDSAGLSTTYSYTNGGRTQTVTRPGGATEVSDKYLDGQEKSLTGTAVVARYFDYGVNADGTRYNQDFIGPSGLNSPRWTKTTSDWLGRTVVVEKPSFTGMTVVQSSFYNSLGQLQKQTTTANTTKLIADTLYEYDQLGQQIRSGLDVDASGTLTLLSTDRLTETETSYQKTGSDWFLITSTKTYLTDNNDTPVIQTERKRLNNFAFNGTEQTVAEDTLTDVAGNNTTLTSTTDRAAKKQTSTKDTPDSNINAVSIGVNGLLQSSTSTTPQVATVYSYDALGRVLSVTDPQAGTSSRSYNSGGQLASSTEGAGTITYTYYDKNHVSAGRLKAQTNDAGKATYFSYNNRGDLTQTWGDGTYPLEYVFDSYGRRSELHTFRGGQNWTASIWPSSSTGSADITKWIYQDSTGLLTQKQDAALKGPGFTYDELGRVKTRVWARGITCTYGYDQNTGELLTVTYSDSTPALTFSYDRGGRQKTAIDAAGSHTRTFNLNGELQTEQISGGILEGVGITVGYDGFLRRELLQTSQGANTLTGQTYGYDSNSRLQSVSSGGQVATYAYYPNSGLLNTTSFTGGTNIARSYDSFGRLQNITITPSADAAQSYSYGYNNLNQRTTLTREDGSYWSYLYNDRGELKSGKKYWSDNSIVWGAQTEYSFDNAGNRTYSKIGGNQLGTLRTSAYANNSLNQSLQQTIPGLIDVAGTAAPEATVTINNLPSFRKGKYFYRELSFDNTSSPVLAQINVIGTRNNFGVGGADVVSQKGGGALLSPAMESFTFDDDGNITMDGWWIYTWDAENRLTSMQSLATTPLSIRRRLEFSYDYMNRRIQKKVYVWNVGLNDFQQQSTVVFVYNDWNLIAEFDSASGVTYFTWGNDINGDLQSAAGIGALLFAQAPTGTYLSSNDANGNVVALINIGTGKYSAEYQYDGFGNLLMSNGDYASQNHFRFSSKYSDLETGLTFYGRRYYRANLGRWISRDPIEESSGPNLYLHTSNDPENRYDAIGLQDRVSRNEVRQVLKEEGVLNWDSAGLDILVHWLGGSGLEANVDGERLLFRQWKTYMTEFNDHTTGPNTNYVDRIRPLLVKTAWSMADLANGTTKSVDTMFPAELRNGEGVIGYEYLHDTNEVDVTPGGFQMQGTAKKVLGGRTDCLRVDFDIVYRWNDRIDPNARFATDRVKARLARMFSNPKDYNLHIRWISESTFYMKSGQDRSFGWPFSSNYNNEAYDEFHGFLP